MKGHEEKLMKIFWLRPAYQSRSQGSKLWRSVKKGGTSLRLTLLVFFFFLVISVLVYAGWIDFGKYSGYASQKALQVNNKKPANTLEFPLDCTAWNHTNTCPKNYPKSSPHKEPFSNPSPGSTCPEYFRWIHEDLKPWKQTGITKEMVEKARSTAHFRLTILGGKVYVEKFRPSIQTRALFTMWGIVQMMRWYPGKLPDLELMFDCDDRPVVQAKNFRKPGSEPPPLFRYCSDWRSLDIVFPDWSFWGWAETNIRPWRNVLRDIKEGNERTKWEDRAPYAYWKGNPNVCPWRADLMKCNATARNDWNARLYVQDWVAESQKGYKGSSLGDQCTHRYKIYIEGWAWSVSEKYILACNSPTLLMTLRWYDFFIRGMIPERHYWPAKAIGEAGSRFIHEDMKMEYVYDYMFHLLNEYAKLLIYKPTIPLKAVELCSESMACSADGVWRNFMEESLEKSPSDSVPCAMPPPYEPQELKAFVDEKVRATKEVEAWENQYWDNRNEKH
ncbi:protein o-glucosyltransferase 1 [Phtheirospermum japonicum]|uniref:Protein o-glucosyltransferase 1 n=1 Tax=Phtheirospermum japonicum TaxID=374723 RepID=A0A830C1W7_9LAMI|nr:protein o-glucosyltransferase 1 [Phtheirospermum japonicum]